MDAAAEGDTVILRCGTYHEWDIQYKPDTTLRSETSDPSCVTIDAGRKGRCLNIEHEGSWPEIEAHIVGINFMHGLAMTGDFLSGGAVYCDDNGSYVFRDCVFESNEAQSGGAVGVRWASNAHFHSCEFRYNTAYTGGAVMASGGNSYFYDCILESNTASGDGGAISGSVTYYGGYLYAYSSIFRENHAGSQGGALHMYNGWLATGTEAHKTETTYRDPSIENCLFVGNEAWSGGAVYTFYGGRYFKYCQFSGNVATNGGAIQSVYIDVSGSRCIDQFECCTFLQNEGVKGSLLVGEGYRGPSFYNSIVTENKGELVSGYFWLEDPLNFSCCDLFGNSNGDWTGLIEDQLGINGNISLDPLLCPGYGSESVYLRSDSPCAEGNNPECGQIGAWPVGCTAARSMTWSEIKTLF